MSSDQSCPVPTPPGRWTWVSSPNGGAHLLAPDGRPAATVYAETWTWFVWSPDGDHGKNGVGDSPEDAKWKAEHVAKVTWYENGWADPLGPGIRQGSSVTLKGGEAAVVVAVYDDEALVTSLPTREPKWKFAPTGVYPLTDLDPLPEKDDAT